MLDSACPQTIESGHFEESFEVIGAPVVNGRRKAILERVLVVLGEQSGRSMPDGADKLIGAEHGITGLDMAEVLERLECEYWVDFQPFVDARINGRKGWFRTRRTRTDPTPRELADYIYSQSTHEPF